MSAALDKISANFPGFKLEEGRANFGGVEANFIYVLENDTAVTDPTRAECGRFEVNSLDHYGVPSTLAQAINIENRLRVNNRFQLLVEDLVFVLEQNEPEERPDEKEICYDYESQHLLGEACGRWDMCSQIREALTARGVTVTKEG